MQLYEEQLIIDYLDNLIEREVIAKPKKIYDTTKKKITGLLSVKVKKQGGKWEYLDYLKPNLLTTVGRDFIHAQVYTNASAGTRGANWVAVTTNASAPAAGDTTLAGEITTNGLGRAEASAGHVAGTNVSTLTITYTAGTTFTAVQKAGTFNASSGGTLMHENTFTATDLAQNDQLSLTWTMTLG